MNELNIMVSSNPLAPKRVINGSNRLFPVFALIETKIFFEPGMFFTCVTCEFGAAVEE